MIAPLGTTENTTLLDYIVVRQGKRSILGYIAWRQHAWWWNRTATKYLPIGAGFFPPTDENPVKFCELMLEDLRQVDILVTLTHAEEYLKEYFAQAKRITLPSMEPYFSIIPWTYVLKGNRVLVVHPRVEAFT